MNTQKPKPTTSKDNTFTNRLNKLTKSEVVPVIKDDELSLLAAGEEAAVFESDNHVLHIARHLQDKGVLVGKVMRGVEPAAKLANLEKHIQAHETAKKK